MEATLKDYFPVFLQLIVVGGFVLANIVLTHLLGPRVRGKKKSETFECGYKTEGNARIPFPVKYFLVAILFVLFDVEVIFLYPWVVNFHALGMTGLVEIFLFLAFLLAGFIYLIKRGALQWEK